MSRSDRILTAGRITYRTKHIAIDADGTGNGAVEFPNNLFVLTGLVRVLSLEGIVEDAALHADVTACWFDLFPTAGASVALTKESGAPAMSSFEVGSFIVKDDIASNIATVKRANVAMFLEETAAFQNPYKPFWVGKKNGAVTQIRFMYTTNADLQAEDGVIHFEVAYRPISVGSSLVPA